MEDVPDFIEGVGLGHWLIEDDEPDDFGQEEPIEGSSQPLPLRDRKKVDRRRLRPFERHVMETIDEANRGRKE